MLDYATLIRAHNHVDFAEAKLKEVKDLTFADDKTRAIAQAQVHATIAQALFAYGAMR